MSAKAKRSKTAQHRPATRKRKFKHDGHRAVDLFSGFGGLTRGIEKAGFTTIMAANHNAYKVEVHEANHPNAEHWICDLVDPDSSDYHSPRDLPPAEMLVAGISCVHHSGANAAKAYAQGRSLFDFEDAEWEERVTKSERDRATAICVLQYAELHHPLVMLIECTTELVSWGDALPNKPSIGDGKTYRWWLNEVHKLGYRSRTLYLNSQFFGVPQSRDRIYIAFWDVKLPTPDLDHRPMAWCGRCDSLVESTWAWRTGVPPSGRVRYGEQYHYVCPRCSKQVVPPMTPSLKALDLSNLGTRIGDRKRPLAPASMARAERCRQRFAEFPAVLMPAKSMHGTEKHPWQPMPTQTSQQETALLSTGAVLTVAGNTFEREGSDCRSRTFAEPLWTQHATNGVGVLTPPIAGIVPYRSGNQPVLSSEPMPTQGALEAMGVLSAGVMPFRANTLPTMASEPMPTQMSDQVAGVLTAAGFIKHNGGLSEAGYRAHPLSSPLGAVTSEDTHGLLFSGWYKQAANAIDTAPHGLDDPLGTLTAKLNVGLLSAWQTALRDLKLDDCYFRMMFSHEVGTACGFDLQSQGGEFIVWGTARDQVDGFGNAVSPPVGTWCGERLGAIL